MTKKPYLVSITKSSSYKDKKAVYSALYESLELIGALEESIYRGKTVLLKPNILKGISYESGATTNPLLIESLIEILQDYDCRIIIAEGAVVGSDTMDAFKACGIDRIAREKGLELVDLKRDSFRELDIPGGKELKKLSIPSTVIQSDLIINIPVIKTHDSFKASLTLKNIKGVISERDKKRFHNKDLSQCIVDLNRLVHTDIAIMDGTVALEGLGPLYGEPVGLNTIISSFDPVAADIVASRVMGIDPESVHYLRLAIKQGISDIKEEDIEIVGKSISEVKRDFKIIDLESGAYSQYGIEVFDKGACSGCMHTLESFLYKTTRKGDLERLKGHRFLLGSQNIKGDLAGKRSIRFGKCAKSLELADSRYIKGCPPHMDTIREVLDIKKKT